MKDKNIRLTKRLETGEYISSPELRKNGHSRCMQKLGKLEDLDEQGRLYILPDIDQGDIVYYLTDAGIAKAMLAGWYIVNDILFGRLWNIATGYTVFLAEDIGKKVFLQRKEAEEYRRTKNGK